MTRRLIVMLAACGGGGDKPEPHVDAARVSTDAPVHQPMTYAMTTIAGDCATLGSPQTLPILGLAHVTDVYTLPGPFPFFGTTRSRFAVAEQGDLQLFDDATANITTLVDPVQIPAAAEPNGFIAPLWTFHLAYIDQRSAVRAAAQDGDVIVEWTDFAVGAIVPDPASHVTMQAKLLHDGAIELHYCQLVGGANTQGEERGAKGSIGIESPDGTKGLSAGFEMPVARIDQAFRFTPM